MGRRSRWEGPAENSRRQTGDPRLLLRTRRHRRRPPHRESGGAQRAIRFASRTASTGPVTERTISPLNATLHSIFRRSGGRPRSRTDGWA